MACCPRCEYEIPDEVCLERAADLGWLHPEEIQAAIEEEEKRASINFWASVIKKGWADDKAKNS